MNLVPNRAGRRAAVFLTAALAITASSAHAQSYTLGGDARTFAMGGAGIAVQYQSMGSRLNPATLAFEGREVQPNFPTLGLRANNVDVNAANYLLSSQRSKDARSLLIQYAGTGDSDFGVNGNAAIRFGKIEVSANAVGVGRLQPNAKLQEWSKAGTGDPLTLTGAEGHVLAAGYYTLPAVAFASTFPAPKTSRNNIAFGLRVKQMKAVYSHYIVDEEALRGRTNTGALAEPRLASEMNGNDTLEQQGVGADFGILIRPRKGDGFSTAFVVTNALKPNFVFNGTDRNGNSARYDLLQTIASAGIGYQNRMTTLAADAVNLAGSNGSMQIRVGGEQRLTRSVALRAGYSSQGGATWGFNLFGFDAAFGKKVPLEIVRTISF